MLLQALTGGHRGWVGGKGSYGMVMDEMARMEAGELGDDPLQQLELREHSLALRAQMFGIWSDANHTPNAGCAPPLPPHPRLTPRAGADLLSTADVMESDLFSLVHTYNQVVGLRPDLSWSFDLLRKAWRIISDPGLVGEGKPTRKLRAETLCNLGGLERRKGKLDASMRYLNKAAIYQMGLMDNFAHKLPKDHVSANAVLKLRFAARSLMNLDGAHGQSDPFLRIAKVPHGGRAAWRNAKDAAMGKEVGKTVWKTNVEMNNLDPKWEKFEIDASRFCGCDTARPTHFAVYDWDKDGTHDLIGMCTASFKEIERAALTKKGMPLTHPRSKLRTGTLFCLKAVVSDEQEQKLLTLQAQVALNFAATCSANNAPEAALKWAKKALISLLTGGALPSDAPIPHPSAIDALMTLPRDKVVLLIVAYQSIGVEQRRLGLPCDDALDTAEAIETRLLQAQQAQRNAVAEAEREKEEEAARESLRSPSSKPRGPPSRGGGLVPHAARPGAMTVEQVRTPTFKPPPSVVGFR